MPTAFVLAAEHLAAVRDSGEARLRLAASFYRGPISAYGRAELSFLRWETARGVLAPAPEGSAWWRAVNERLLRDKAEAALLRDGVPGEPSASSVAVWSAFIDAPSPASWYRAHNASVVAGYLEHEELAALEVPAERFMMNVALLRVLYTHAMVAMPRLALGILSPLGRWLGDPRGGAVGFFLDLRRSFPATYPLTGLSVDELVGQEGRLPQALDYGVILPRLTAVYAYAAASLGQPRVVSLLRDGVPSYANPTDSAGWRYSNADRLLPRLAAWATLASR